MPSIGSASLQIIPSFDGIQGYLDRGTSAPLSAAGTKGGVLFGQSAGKSAGSRFGKVFSSAAKASVLGLAGAGALAFKVGKDSIAQASDLNESLNAVNVTYEKQAEGVKKLGEEAADALGLSNTEFNGLSVQFSGFVEQIAGGDGQKVVGTLDDLTTRAADFASVMNLDVAEAARLFQSGLAGETEPLRKFGIDLSAAAVESFALAEGIQKQGTEFTETEKVQARYKLLMEKTQKSAGDFANTSDSLANQQRILNARWDDAQAKLGTALLPIVEDFTKYLVDEGVPAVEKFAGWFTDTAVPAISDFADEIKPAVGAVKDLAGFLNDLPSEAKLAALSTLIGGGALLKLRGGSGRLGAVGSALGVTKPIPVIVTNPGFAAGGAGGTRGSTGAVVATNGKGGKHAATRSGGGRGVGALALLPLVPEIIEELRWPWTEGPFAPKNFKSGIGATVKDAAVEAAQVTADAMLEFDKKVPKTLRRHFELLGVPESEEHLRHLLRTYDIVPRKKVTTLELLGYEPMLDRIQRINRELDWAARPREARISITKVYADAGYETRGGLQQGGGTTTTQTGRSRAGGGLG